MANAAELVGVTTARLSWSPASGPVEGYFVYAARNGEALPGRVIAATSSGTRDIQVSGLFGDSVVVSVAAFAADGSVGPLSFPSETLDFVADPATGGGSAGATPPPLSDEGLVFVATPLDSVLSVQSYRVDGSLRGSFNLVIEPGTDPAGMADLRPALCDLDGDGGRELVMGFGTGSGGRIEVRRSAADGYAHLATIRHSNARYVETNGETFPACGDVDGDGLDEIVIGHGVGGRGVVDIYDDAYGDYRWLGFNAVAWTEYMATVGASHPAVGDLDGDGYAEIVLGVGAGGQGFLYMIDDMARAFRPLPGTSGDGWVQLELPPGADGATWPTMGDVDGDGVDEVVVGLGDGGQGLVHVFEGLDLAAGHYRVGTPLGAGWVQAGFEPLNSTSGRVVPSVYDLDGDGLGELALAFGEGSTLEIREDASQGFAPGGGLVGNGGLVDQAVWGLSARGPAIAR